jgi:N-acylglucosamine-6-phosphate 2-epimerase
MNNNLSRIARGIIVSSQATHGEPLNRPDILCAMAESALQGGACGIRMAQVENLRYFRERHPDVPLIGITKPDIIPPNATELVYITPTLADVQAIAPYCDIIALDATARPRPGGETLEGIVREARRQFPHRLLMADIATLSEGLRAAELGFDLIGTTLSGYTSDTQKAPTQTGTGKTTGPDFALLSALTARVKTPVILEGRIWEPADVTQAFQQGAHAVVIGSAVTRPHEITCRFVQAIPTKG